VINNFDGSSSKGSLPAASFFINKKLGVDFIDQNEI